MGGGVSVGDLNNDNLYRFIKTAAKPVAAYFKAEAPKSPLFSKLCSTIGQTVHTLSSRLNVLVSGYKFVGVKPLEYDVALSKGVEYIAEFIVIGASGTIIMIEFTRSEKKNAIKAAKQSAKEMQIDRVRPEILGIIYNCISIYLGSVLFILGC